ncbi:MAG TPA: GntR family transcriptional regulator [Thermoanaerobaculia bacterium]|nr:GntR family transcriptional regulator [Thermoanaerobaculia bacterium]
MFDIQPSSSTPIWQQIEEGVRRMITVGVLVPGDAVPSVRDLARTLRVNPNTVARSYQRLIDRGVLTVRRGEGTYVSDAPAQPKKSERAEKLRDAATQYAATALSLGATIDEATAEVQTGYQRLGRELRRKS